MASKSDFTPEEELKMLRQQITFESFVNSFYLDLIVNHAIEDDGYYKFIMELVREHKDAANGDLQQLTNDLKKIPAVIREKVMNGELKDLLDL